MGNEFIRNVIGSEYLVRSGKSMQENSEFVREAFAEISRINRELFSLVPFEVVYTSDDYYASAKEMRERVVSENKIYIYDGWEGHDVLTLEDNLIGRTVHDVFSHLVCGCSFSFEGELSAYYEQRKYYPQWTWGVLFAEIVGQTCAYKFNGDSHSFPQRAINAPKKWMDLAELVKLPDYSHNSVLQPFYKLEEVI